MTTRNGHSAAQTDYNLHGIVGVRLLNASPADAAAVSRQLGPIQGSLTRPPDITIRFVERLALSSPVHYLGVDEVGFTDDAFLILRSKHKAQAMVQIRFEQIGGPCEITCQTGLPAVPLLIPILNLTALARGALPLHASAFTYNGTGVLNTGWSKGGKTEMLLAFTSRGASYVGDEWVYLSSDGRHMYGIPEPVRLWDWHLQDLPHYRSRVSAGDQARLRAIKLVQAVDRTISRKPINKLFLGKVMRRARPVLKNQLHVDLHPEQLFGRTGGSLSAPVDKVFFVASHESSQVHVQPVDPQQVARRMVFSLQYERLNFMSYYLAFRFAFPDIKNDFIEQTEELQRDRLLKMLVDKETYAVYHPYPVSIPALFDKVSAVI